MSLRRTRVIGTGSYVPPRVVTNEELTKLMDTTDEWIVQRTGIQERHWVDLETTTSDLGMEAATRALAAAGVDKKDIDMIFFATLSPDYEFPGTGAFFQDKMGMNGTPALDVRQQCSGFLVSLSMADQFIRTGFCDRILVVGAEVHSKGLDVSTRGRDLAVLFGDGAGSVVLEATEVNDPRKDPHILSTHLHMDGKFAKELWAQAPGQAYPHERINHEILDRGEHYPKMNGRTVYMHAVKRMPEAIHEALDANGHRPEDVDIFVFHQANLRINEAVTDRLGVPHEKVWNTIHRFGNTTAATIPLGLDTAVQEGRLKPGMLLASAAFGSGFTWASMLVRW
jgi:3-oxoacyl-[acyl-carrier-protein] synthase-3